MTGTTLNKVIAHFTDGRLIRGSTLDFHPTREVFHVREDDGPTHEIHLVQLKAVFFVRELDGDPEYTEKKGFFTRHVQGKKIMVQFDDGEVLFGTTLSYSTRGLGFFVFPGDPQCNNSKVFIVHAATRRVKLRSLPDTNRPQNYSR